MKVTQPTPSQKVHEGNRFTSCFGCNTCLSTKDPSEIGGPLFLGNINTASILTVMSAPRSYRQGLAYQRMQYLSSLPEGSCSEALKGALEAEFFGSEAYTLMSTLCQMTDGKNAFVNGDVLVTDTVRCLDSSEEFLEANYKTCAVWTTQVISLAKPKGIIIMGSIAAKQVLGSELASSIGMFEIRKHPTRGPVLMLPEASEVTHRKNVEKSQNMFEEFYKKVMK